MLRLLVYSFLLSSAIGFWLLRHTYLKGSLTGEHGIHRYAVPRIGGLLVFAGMFGAMLIGFAGGSVPPEVAVPMLFAAAPVFAIGLIEDIRGGLRPRVRLLAAFASAAIGIWLFGDVLSRLDLPFVDGWLAWLPLAVCLTIFAVGGVTHAFNIIDGLNGLAGGIALLVLGALTYVAYHVQDHALAQFGIVGIGAVLGFLVWNYPSGQIFLGDAGAYLLGFVIAQMSVLLVARHAEVSAWFPLLLVVYPFCETLFSAYRRKILRKRSAASADRLHLHTLLYKRLPYGINYRRAMGRYRQRNSDVSVFAWMLAAATVAPAVLWWRDTTTLEICVVVFCLFYLHLYRRLVKFRIQKRNPAQNSG